MKPDTGTVLKKSDEIRKIHHYAIISAALWTLLLSGLFIAYIVDNRTSIREIGQSMVRAAFEKDVLFRRWGVSHGGVYVPLTDTTPANPYLADYPERDITTPSGRRLTLINPAYMTRQIFELARENAFLPQGHITSLNPLRPENAPDAWETKALKALEQGKTEIIEPVTINGQPHLRLMRPLLTEKPCLPCHAGQGYKEGDSRGGISVSLSLTPIQQAMNHEMLQEAFIHSFIWLLGMGIIWIGTRKIVQTMTLLGDERNKLYESQSHLQSIFDNEPECIKIIDAQGFLIQMNPAGLAMIEADSLEQVAGRPILNIIAPEYHTMFVDLHKRVIAGESIQSEYELIGLKGGRRLMQTHAVPMLDHGRVVHLAVTRDITESKRAETALLHSRAELKAIYDHAPAMMCVVDTERHILYANPAYTNFTGITDDDLKSGHACGIFGCIYSLEDPRGCGYGSKCINCELRLAIEDTFATGMGHLNIEHHTTLALRGSQRNVALLASTALIQSADQTNMLLCLNDITERTQAQTALRESEARYRSILIASPDYIAITDLEGRILMISPMALTFCRCEQEDQLLGHRITDFIVPEDQERALGNVARMFQGIVTGPSEYRGLRMDGTTFDMEANGEFIRDAEGLPTGMVYIIRDISERKHAEQERIQLEQQFHHAQKLESLGVLAGGIAHDFNNILTVILGHCYMAGEDTEPDKIKVRFQQIEAAGNRAAELCRQMLTYAGKTPLVQTRVNLWLLVDEVVNMLQSAIKKNVAIEIDLNQRVPEIKGDAGQLQQIVMNLIINAAEAVGDSNGTVKVILSKMDFAADQSERDTFGTVIAPGRYVCLEVTDSGSGMDDETQKRIFEPFFTTKFTGRGLGMSAIQGIVASHDGILHLTSAPGAGTTFKICFPVPSAFDNRETISATVPLTDMACGTILLVDDEQTLRDMGTALLDAMGFTALTAQHGTEALEIYRERGSEIDVVLLDLIMPVMGGIETYHELRKIDQNLPIIICSGYSVESVENIIETDQHACFVHKPYKPDQLRISMMQMKG